MSNLQRKTVEKKMVAETPVTYSSRGTFGGTSRKTISRSKSLMSVSSSSSVLRMLVDENEGINPLEKEMEVYEEEYSMYLLRVLQSNILRNEGEREDEAKKCLVSLKKEFEDLLLENTALYDQVHKIEIHLKSLQKLQENLSRIQKLLNILRVTEFDDVLQKISLTLEANVNRLQLVTLRREDIDEAFSKNLLGFESDVYKLLKRMEEHATEHEALLPEIVEKVNEIRSLHAENEKLKIRCTMHANQLRKKTIVSDYEKYFRMATEECRDILDKIEDKRIVHSFADESLPQRTSEWGEPASSSTPANTAVSVEAMQREEPKSQI